MILSGAVPVLSGWSKRFNDVIYIAPFVIIIVFVCIMFYITKEISVLRRKNQELDALITNFHLPESTLVDGNS